MTYLYIFIILAFFAFCELSNIGLKRKKALCILSFFLLMLMAGLRYETGGDWPNYTIYFNNIEPFNQVLSGNRTSYDNLILEPGYKLLISFVKIFTNDVQVLFFLICLFTFTLLFKSFVTYSSHPITSLLIYYGTLYFTLDMIVIRQSLAFAIIFYGYRYIEKQKIYRFTLCILIASLFHTSALLMFPIYFIVKRTYSSKTLFIFFILSYFVLFFQIKWLALFIKSGLEFIIDPGVADKLVQYATNEVYAVNRGLTLGSLVNIITFFTLLFQRKKLSTIKYFNLFLNLFVIYIFIYCCMFEMVEFSNRLKYYFMISFSILLPMLVHCYYKIKNRVLIYLSICVFSLMYSINIFLDRPGGIAYNPYQNYIWYKLTGKKSDGLQRLEKNNEEFLKERGQ